MILPVFYLPYIVYQQRREQIPVQYDLVSPSWQVLFIMLLSAGLVISLLAVRFPALQKGPLRLATRRPVVTLTLMMVF